MRSRLQQIATNGCQASIVRSPGLRKGGWPIRQLAAALLVLGSLLTLPFASVEARSQDDDDIPDHLFSGTSVPEQAKAIAQTASGSSKREKLISPPGENPYYPVRTDGQPFILNVDTTVNLTKTLNEFYWNPKWRGEVWSPFDLPETIERASRVMSTWPEYDSENMFRIGTKPSQWLERYSGYGP